jgi:predicted HicB family RNase H-like nuclease
MTPNQPTTGAAKAAKTEVLNIRITAELKAALVAEAIRDSRSVSQIAERCLLIGVESLNPPPPPPAPQRKKARK